MLIVLAYMTGYRQGATACQPGWWPAIWVPAPALPFVQWIQAWYTVFVSQRSITNFVETFGQLDAVSPDALKAVGTAGSVWMIKKYVERQAVAN